MKKPSILLVLAAVFSLISCGNAKKEVPKISIFCDHIEEIVKQEGLSFAQAATLLKEHGYTGADIRVFQNPDEIKTLDSLGFEHACAITEINYAREDQSELEDQTIAFMDSRGFDRLLLVAGFIPQSGFSQEEMEAARERIAAFAARVAAKGYSIMVEDYDNRRSFTYNADRIDSLFVVSKDLGLVFDTGNFIYAGDDTMTHFQRFSNKIGHVHLKDRTAPDNMTCVPAGEGCVPVKEIVKKLKDSGYQGWYTIEQYGSRNMLQDSYTAYNNVYSVLTAE
ncbi:MAG: sugar phosphate isomerase/epimerase [Bacteroidales bacterium]|nr:sugar phosphate isomerase/epimerase [Bacteroidales bacterium]